ncbi:MAG: SprT family zinc-dependent metalloprotease [Syntrophomonadaceae bacterium]
MQLSFQYQNRIIEFDVIYRPRKTMSIRVEPPDRVIVVAPVGIKKELVLEKVKDKGRWIAEKLDACRTVGPTGLEQLKNGASIMYRGEKHLLYIEDDHSQKKSRVKILDRSIHVKTPDPSPEAIKGTLETCFRKLAREAIEGRIRFYQPALPKRPNRVFIKAQRRRWGSCSSLGNLNFNWKIIMLPPVVFDYIVVHEMCHLVYLNHSREFWALVASILPDYKESYQWLRKHTPVQLW